MKKKLFKKLLLLCFLTLVITNKNFAQISASYLQSYNTKLNGVSQINFSANDFLIKTQIKEKENEFELKAISSSLECFGNTKIYVGNLSYFGIASISQKPQITLSNALVNTSLLYNPLRFQNTTTGEISKLGLAIKYPIGSSFLGWELTKEKNYSLWFLQNFIFSKKSFSSSISLFAQYNYLYPILEPSWYCHNKEYFEKDEIRPNLIFSFKLTGFYFSVFWLNQYNYGASLESALRTESLIKFKTLSFSFASYYEDPNFKALKNSKNYPFQLSSEISFKPRFKNTNPFSFGVTARGLYEIQQNKIWYLPNTKNTELKLLAFFIFFDSEIKGALEYKNDLLFYSFNLLLGEVFNNKGSFELQGKFYNDKDVFRTIVFINPIKLLNFQYSLDLETGKKEQEKTSYTNNFRLICNYKIKGIRGNIKLDATITTKNANPFFEITNSIYF